MISNNNNNNYYYLIDEVVRELHRLQEGLYNVEYYIIVRVVIIINYYYYDLTGEAVRELARGDSLTIIIIIII